MSYKPLLSVILCFRNQRDMVEASLSSLFDMQSIPFELFIVDDASTDGTGDAIQSLLDYYDHEHTFFFQHQQQAGRANSLNEILPQVSAPVVWTPVSIEQIDERLLLELLREAADADAVCFLQGSPLPGATEDWINLASDGPWPPDGAFLWNLDQIPSTERFFNPYQKRYHGLEMAVRLKRGHTLSVQRVTTFSTATVFEKDMTPALSDRTELLYTLGRYAGEDSEILSEALKRLKKLKADAKPGKQDTDGRDLLAKAIRLQDEGRFSPALELVDRVLEKNPGHPRAKQLKLQILEKKRRFVEASELKHEINSAAKSEGDIKTSLIIPSALHSKAVLEHCLISVSEHCDPEHLELIVIDNASLDDTHDYLSDLEAKNFFNCSVITNSRNRGFAASVNQGLDKARGEYALVMHNDVSLNSNLPEELARLMDAHPGYAVIGPMADKTLNPDQAVRNRDTYDSPLAQTEYLDSFCMMIRLDTDLRMDENYGLAFFEDIDFCFEARKHGLKAGIATGVSVEHHYGTSTFALSLDTDSEQYWKNVAYFNEKWGVNVYSEEDLKSKSTFDQLLALDEIVNPMFPEDSIKEYFHKLFTDELKTEMMRSEHDPETLCRLVHLMMVMEQRDVMRRLEDRLDNIDLPASLIYQLVRFYFNRNIYSRCLHYLDCLKAEQQSLQSELYKLEIMINDKDLEQAVPKLSELLEKAPSHPTLYKLAGDVHEFEGNPEEAESFYEIAHQINPFEYSTSGEKEFKLKE